MHHNCLIVYTAIVVKGVTLNVPVKLVNSDELSFSISTKGWTEHLTHAIPYRMNMEYSEFALNGKKLCEKIDDEIRFQVREYVKLDRFIKE